MKNCGQRFHQELGKFKFLNELIRLISPKVCGEEVVYCLSHFVRDKCLGLSSLLLGG